MNTSSQPPFTTEDLFRYRALSVLESGPRQDWCVFPVKRALRQGDSYETTLWGLRPGRDAQARQLTAAVFDASHARLKPDGSALAFLSARDKAGLQVHLLPMEGGEAQRLTHARKPTLDTLEGWAPDGTRLLATARVDCIEDGEDPGGSAGRPPQVATYAPYKQDGSGTVTGSRSHLFAIAVATGEATALTQGDFDVGAGAWSPDGRQLAYLRGRSGRDRHRTDLWLADAYGGEPRVLVDSLASLQAFAWSPDGRRIALAGTRVTGDSRVELYVADVASGTLRRLVDEDFELSTAAALQWHPDGRRMAVIADLRGVHRLAIVDADGDAPPQVVSRGLRSLQALAQCGERLVYVAMGMRRLNQVYSCRWHGSDEQRHTRLNPWFSRRPHPRVRKRGFSVPDGRGGHERIEAWVLLPAQGDGPFPLLVDMHGGPHSIVLTDYTAHTYWYLLLSRGWAIVAPNAVGSTSYGKAFAERLIGKWGELDLPQYEAVVDQLQREGLADERLACAGKSYGGFLSAWAVGHSERFRAAAVAAPVANILSHMGTSDTGYYVTPFAMGCTPEEDPALYRRLSAVTYCDRVTTPTLILQGENDGRCPRGQGEELYTQLVRCGRCEVQLVLYPRSTHAEAESGRPGNRVDYHQRLADWVDRHAKRD